MSEATAQFEDIQIPLVEPVDDVDSIPGVLGVPEWWPTGSRLAVVLAQGSAAEDPLLNFLQAELTERKILTLRFPFPYMVAGKKKQDSPADLQRCFEAAVSVLGRDPTAAPAHVFAGGKNLGALAAVYAATGRARIEGLFFLGYPLHKQDDPSDVRSEKLYRVINPMLFVQGTKDRHCDLPTLRQTLGRVGAPVQLHVVDEADHSLKVAKRSGRSPEDVQSEVLTVLEGWIHKTLGE